MVSMNALSELYPRPTHSQRRYIVEWKLYRHGGSNYRDRTYTFAHSQCRYIQKRLRTVGITLV